jgi:hypothetical protein
MKWGPCRILAQSPFYKARASPAASENMEILGLVPDKDRKWGRSIPKRNHRSRKRRNAEGIPLLPETESSPRSPIAAKVAVAGLLAVAAIASAQTAPLTIDNAVALALKGNREVQSAALEVERASEETAALKTTRLPQFQIYAQGGQLLRQVSFTVPQGALGTFAATLWLTRRRMLHPN